VWPIWNTIQYGNFRPEGLAPIFDDDDRKLWIVALEQTVKNCTDVSAAYEDAKEFVERNYAYDSRKIAFDGISKFRDCDFSSGNITWTNNDTQFELELSAMLDDAKGVQPNGYPAFKYVVFLKYNDMTAWGRITAKMDRENAERQEKELEKRNEQEQQAKTNL